MSRSTATATASLEYRDRDRVVARCPPPSLRRCRSACEGTGYGRSRTACALTAPGTGAHGDPWPSTPRTRDTRYGRGHHFSPHRDGPFVVADHLRSVYTQQVCLNDASEFDGIASNLQDPSQPLSPQCWTFGCLSPPLSTPSTTATAVGGHSPAEPFSLSDSSEQNTPRHPSTALGT